MRVRNQLQHVLTTIANLPDRPADLKAVLAQAPPPSSQPLPQFTWTALGLVHYRQRKAWAWATVHQRLAPLIERCFREKKCLVGVVPGHVAWQYQLQRDGSALIHRGTGERLALALSQDPELMDGEDFGNFLREHRAPGSAEQRLRELFPDCSGLFLTIESLLASGFLHRHGRSDPLFRLDGTLVPTSAMEKFLDRWADPAQRLWLASQIGDWPAALDLAVAHGDRTLVEDIAPRAEACRQRWLRRLRRQVGREGLAEESLAALAHVQAEDLPDYLDRGLAGEAACAAIALIGDDPAWCAKVYDRLFRELRRRRQAWNGLLLERAASHLSAHAYRVDEIITRLLALKHPPLRALIPLAIEHRPDLLRPLLRDGLRSPEFDDIFTAAAVLVLLNTTWSWRDLVSVCNEISARPISLEWCLALRAGADPEADPAVEAWEAEHLMGKAEIEGDECWHPADTDEKTFWMDRPEELVQRNRAAIESAVSEGS